MALDFPSNPVNNQVYGNFYWDSSMSAWRATGTSIPAVPAGVVSQFMGTTAPSGYLLCTGQSVLVADYPALFAVIGYNYGGSGLNFTVPNMQGRVPVGKSSTGTFNVTLNSSAIGGEEKHLLTSEEMPAHVHTQNSVTMYDTNTIGGWGGDFTNGTGYKIQTRSTWTTASAGGLGGVTQSHNILQPYMVVNYIIKT